MFNQFPPIEDSGIAPRFMLSPSHRVVYSLLILAAVALALLLFPLFVKGSSNVYLIATIAGLGILLGLISRSVQKIKVTHQLTGYTLLVDRVRVKTKQSLKYYPREYDLRTLRAALKVGETRQTLQQNQVYIFPSKLVLICDAQPGRQQQVILQRPYVSGGEKHVQSLQRELDSWDRICSTIESEALPDALAQKWRSVPLYDRYWFVLLQAEIEFLQGKSTAPQMCLATLRSILNIIRRGGSILKGVWMWLVLAYFVFGGVALTSGWLGFKFFIDETGKFTLSFMWFFLPTFLIAAGYYILFLFEPLSRKVRKEIDNRAKQARRLIQAGLTTEDLEPILSLLKHEGERVKHTLSTLTVATALPALLTSLPRFFGASTSRISDFVLAVSVVAFAIVQLYYFTQVRILQSAETSCLIAKSELGKANE
jgi:hypothetical protein